MKKEKTTETEMFDRDTLYNFMYKVIESEYPNSSPGKLEQVTDKLSDAVSEWCPKKGDFWLNEDDGFLYVNKGWGVVCSEALE